MSVRINVCQTYYLFLPHTYRLKGVRRTEWNEYFCEPIGRPEEKLETEIWILRYINLMANFSIFELSKF